MNSNVNNYKTGLYKAISWGNYMKGKFKNCIMLLTLLLLLSVVNGLTAYAAESSDPYVNITNKTLYRGYKNYQIKIENLKKGSTVSYTTSNSKVAKVSKSGIISPIGKGKAIITINIKQNNKSFKDKINVTVKNPYIIINSSVNVLEVGSNVKLKAKIYGMDGNIKWSVSDKEIATINSSTGKLTAKKPGKVSVIAKCKGIKDSCEIEINTPYDNYKDIWSYTFVSNSPYMTLYSVEQSPNKNIYVSGTEGEDAFVALLSPKGELLWKNYYGGSNDDSASLLLPLDNGDCIVGGGTTSTDGDIVNSYGKCDYWLFRLDSEGKIKWSMCYGDGGCDFIESIILTSDDNIVFTGTSFSEVLMYATIFKVDVDTGRILWQQAFDGSGSEGFSSVGETSDGGFIAAGFTFSIDGNFTFRNKAEEKNAFWIAKLDRNGLMEWQDCIDVDEVNASFLEGIAVHQTEDGNFLSMARSYDKNVVLFKYNEDGTLGWSKELYLEAYDYWWEDFNNKIVRTYDMQLTDDGGCICYGHYFGGKLIKLNTDGDVIYEYYTNSHLDNIRYINPVNHSMITSYISSDSEKEPSFSLTYWTHSNNKVK